MKTAVVYYSMGGNTRHVAEKIADQLGADLIPITPQKAYPDKGMKKFIWGGKSAVMGEKPALTPYTFRADAYDRVILGFPVWASSFAPPIRTFIHENKAALRGKKIAAFTCFAGSGADKALKKLRDCLGRDSLERELILIDPKDSPTPEKEQQLADFCSALTQENAPCTHFA